MTAARLATVLVLSIAGCVTHVPATEVVVVIDGEPTIVRDAQRLHMIVLGGARGTTLTSQADQIIGSATSPIHWPTTVALTPAMGDSNRLFAIEADAVDAMGATIGIVRARSSYIAGRTLELRLTLEDCCRTVASTCATDQTCRGCMCTSAALPVSSLPDYTRPDAGARDVGAATDTRVADGGRLTSTGADGAFAPTSSMMLPSGVYNFTTITIPVGVVLHAGAGGSLDLRATGDVMIAGDIDLSGGRGASPTPATGAGGGGSTATGVDGMIGPTGGGAGGGGGDAVGRPGAGGGAAFPSSGPYVGGGGSNGGGGGGWYTNPGGDNGGGGGGGYAGGGGGASADRGVGWGQGGGGGGVGPPGGLGGVPAGHGAPTVPSSGAPYDGSAGRDAAVLSGGAAGGGGGAGGAIALDAAADLAIITTFRCGSGGGGGGSWAGGGGGGGGGAIRITTPTTLTISGHLLARGGDGGAGANGGGGGGGGSGGAIVLSAAALAVTGEVRARGGAGGAPNGGAGGLGRIRIDVGSGSCSLIAGTFEPALHDRCTPSTLAGFTYLTTSP